MTRQSFCLLAFLAIFLATPLSLQAESEDTDSKDTLKITATRLAWPSGPVSKTNEVTAGDALCYTLDIFNLPKNTDGDVGFILEAKMIFPENIGGQKGITFPPMRYMKQVFSDPNAKKVKRLSLGNTVLVVPPDIPKTDGTLEVKVLDYISGQTSKHTSAVQVVPCEGLTIIRPYLSLDPSDQNPSGGNFTVGQRILVSCQLVTSKLLPPDRIGKVHLEAYSVPDDKLVFAVKPESLFGSTFIRRGFDPNYSAVARFCLALTQTGKYNLRLIVRDDDSKDLASKTFPIEVHDRVESLERQGEP